MLADIITTNTKVSSITASLGNNLCSHTCQFSVCHLLFHFNLYAVAVLRCNLFGVLLLEILNYEVMTDLLKSTLAWPTCMALLVGSKMVDFNKTSNFAIGVLLKLPFWLNFRVLRTRVLVVMMKGLEFNNSCLP